MTAYLGICMVILVTGLVISILARLVTGGILDEFERIRQKRSEKRWDTAAKYIAGTIKYVMNDENFKKILENENAKKVNKAFNEGFEAGETAAKEIKFDDVKFKEELDQWKKEYEKNKKD